MNREIKFRAWDKFKKVFIPNDVWGVVQTDFNAFGIMLKDWENYKEGEYFYQNTQEIQQYTGLKDRNGKEIYEGDILKVGENLTAKIDYIENNVDDYGDEINCAFHAVIIKHNKTIPIDGYFKKNCEVIGNIYENPELLKS